MKNSESLLQSAKARLDQAKKTAASIQRRIDRVNDEGCSGKQIASLRLEAEAVLQCVHEFSAYWNAYETS